MWAEAVEQPHKSSLHWDQAGITTIIWEGCCVFSELLLLLVYKHRSLIPAALKINRKHSLTSWILEEWWCHLNRNFYRGCRWGVCAWLSESYISFFLPSLPHYHFLDKILICEGISVPFPMQLIPLALPLRLTWCSLLAHCGVKSDSRKLQFGHTDTEHQCRTWFVPLAGTFPWACGVGRNSACGHGICSKGRNLEYVLSFNLRMRLYLLLLGFGLALKGIKPSHLTFYSAMVIRNAWSTQECSLSITCKR